MLHVLLMLQYGYATRAQYVLSFQVCLKQVIWVRSMHLASIDTLTSLQQQSLYSVLHAFCKQLQETRVAPVALSISVFDSMG